MHHTSSKFCYSSCSLPKQYVTILGLICVQVVQVTWSLTITLVLMKELTRKVNRFQVTNKVGTPWYKMAAYHGQWLLLACYMDWWTDGFNSRSTHIFTHTWSVYYTLALKCGGRQWQIVWTMDMFVIILLISDTVVYARCVFVYLWKKGSFVNNIRTDAFLFYHCIVLHQLTFANWTFQFFNTFRAHWTAVVIRTIMSFLLHRSGIFCVLRYVSSQCNARLSSANA